MTFIEATKRLKNGQAARPSGWLGYLKRVDTAEVKAFSAEATFHNGDVCRYMSRLYFRSGPDGAAPYPVPTEDVNWTEICDIPHKLVLQVRSGITDYFTSVADVTGGRVKYGNWMYHETPPSETPGLYLDGELFTAMLFGNWELGSAEAFEAQRVDQGSIW